MALPLCGDADAGMRRMGDAVSGHLATSEKDLAGEGTLLSSVFLCLQPGGKVD